MRHRRTTPVFSAAVPGAAAPAIITPSPDRVDGDRARATHAATETYSGIVICAGRRNPPITVEKRVNGARWPLTMFNGNPAVRNGLGQRDRSPNPPSTDRVNGDLRPAHREST